MYMPAGILSISEIPMSWTLLGLINSMLMVDEEPPKTVEGWNPFTTSIARSLIVNWA